MNTTRHHPRPDWPAVYALERDIYGHTFDHLGAPPAPPEPAQADVDDGPGDAGGQGPQVDLPSHQEIIALYRSGQTTKQIAHAHGLTSRTVAQMLAENGAGQRRYLQDQQQGGPRP